MFDAPIPYVKTIRSGCIESHFGRIGGQCLESQGFRIAQDRTKVLCDNSAGVFNDFHITQLFCQMLDGHVGMDPECRFFFHLPVLEKYRQLFDLIQRTVWAADSNIVDLPVFGRSELLFAFLKLLGRNFDDLVLFVTKSRPDCWGLRSYTNGMKQGDTSAGSKGISVPP